jgi:hypothetical protein
MDTQNREFYKELQCITHHQSLCGKTLKFEHVMKDVLSVVNFIQPHRLNHCQFQSFLLEIDAEYYNVCIIAESWGSAETLLALRLEIEMLMNENDKVMAELSDEKWLQDSALLHDISHHSYNLHTEFQSQ